MTQHTTYDGRALEQAGGTLLLSDPRVNVVPGVVQAQHVGLTHTTVRMRAGRRVDLRIRLLIDDDRWFFPGQAVMAVIPAEAVRVEAGFFRRSRQRLNRWYGRIVLITPLDDGSFITAKLHGEGWTLTSTQPVVGSTHAAYAWDPVTLVVEPQRIALFPCRRQAPRERAVLERYRY